MTEKRLQEIEQKIQDHPCYYLERELLAEVRELQLEVKVLSQVIKHYNTALIHTLSEADALMKRGKRPYSAKKEEEAHIERVNQFLAEHPWRTTDE